MSRALFKLQRLIMLAALTTSQRRKTRMVITLLFHLPVLTAADDADCEEGNDGDGDSDDR